MVSINAQGEVSTSPNYRLCFHKNLVNAIWRTPREPSQKPFTEWRRVDFPDMAEDRVDGKRALRNKGGNRRKDYAERELAVGRAFGRCR